MYEIGDKDLDKERGDKVLVENDRKRDEILRSRYTEVVAWGDGAFFSGLPPGVK